MSPGNLTDLIIVGAGGASCGIVEIVEEINAGTRCWNLLGFLDDDPAKIGKLIVGYPVLGPIAAVAAYPAAKLIVGVASYHNRGARHRIIERLACPIERFATIVSPSAKVSRHASIGMGSSICGLAVYFSRRHRWEPCADQLRLCHRPRCQVVRLRYVGGERHHLRFRRAGRRRIRRGGWHCPRRSHSRGGRAGRSGGRGIP